MATRAKKANGVVVVLDVGTNVCAGPEETFFTRAKECLINLLQKKIFSEKCLDLVGIVLLGTSGTDNLLAEDDDFQNVTVMRELQRVDWDIVEQVFALRCGGSSGDWLDAVVVAMDMLHNYEITGMDLEEKKIVLFTDFSSEFSLSRLEEVTAGLEASEMQMVVIGPEFSDDSVEEIKEEVKEFSEDSGDEIQDEHRPMTSNDGRSDTRPPKKEILNWNGKPKTVGQQAGETLAEEMVAKTGGLLCSFKDALLQLIYFEHKDKGSACWNTTLDIGPDFKIAITGKIIVQASTLPSWRRGYMADPSKLIRDEVSYHLDDDVQTEVEDDEVIDGYLFGTTLVPCSDEDMSRMYSSDSPRSMSILGFADVSKVPHRLRFGNQVLAIIAPDGDEIAAEALSALIHALAELDKVAIARRVYSKNYDPAVGALFPEINENYECLLWIQLPYAQDIQPLRFPSLQKKMDTLTEEEKDTVGSLISAMALDEDSDDNLDPREVLNPQPQHVYSTLTHLALHPDDKEIHKPAPHILSILEPSTHAQEAQIQVAEALKRLFPSRLVGPVSKRNRNVFDVEDKTEDEGTKKAKTGDTFSRSDVTEPELTRVSTESPVSDFMKLLQREAPDFDDICNQMGKVVLLLMDSLMESFSRDTYNTKLDKVLECLKAFRRESGSINPQTYNTFLPSLKDVVAASSQNDFWEKLREGGLGLITTEENSRSKVKTEEATAFLQLGQNVAAVDMEDLLDQL